MSRNAGRILEYALFCRPYPRGVDGAEIKALFIITTRGRLVAMERRAHPRGDRLSFYRVSRPEAKLLSRYMRHRSRAAGQIEPGMAPGWTESGIWKNP